MMIRVLLPTHLWRLANVEREVNVALDGPPTIAAVLDAVERDYPMLRGTIREHASKERRAYLRFFMAGEDWSLEPLDTPLPETVVSGAEAMRIVGAMAGG